MKQNSIPLKQDGLPILAFSVTTAENVATPEPDEKSFEFRARRECSALAEMLIAKNRSYGDSALNPLRVFSRSDAIEQIKVRIDDKLSRVSRGSEIGEDTVFDLLGYLVLLRLAIRGEKA